MRTLTRARGERGQSAVEMAIVLPLLIVLVLGVVEVSYGLMDQHVVTKLTREGSNLISRDTSLGDAANVLKNMASRPVNFDSTSKGIFTVIRKGATTGTANFGADIIYQRYEFGALSASSALMEGATSGGTCAERRSSLRRAAERTGTGEPLPATAA